MALDSPTLPITDTLEELLKKSSGILGGLSRGSKFGGLDIKRVCFFTLQRFRRGTKPCFSSCQVYCKTLLVIFWGNSSLTELVHAV